MPDRIAYAHGGSPTPLIGETIGENFDRIAETNPDAEAVVVVHERVRWTYRELAERVAALARGLVTAGLRPGDRMGVWAPNCVEWILVQYASAKAGVILVNINPAYRTSELEYVLCQSGCRLLVSARAFKTSDYVEMVAEVRPRCANLERTVFLETGDWEELLSAGDAAVALPE